MKATQPPSVTIRQIEFELEKAEHGMALPMKPSASCVLAGTRSDRGCLVERSGFGVRCRQAAIIFSLVIGIASRNVCIGVLPKHQRP